MAYANFVIYTDRLDEVHAFWQDHFGFVLDEDIPNGFGFILAYSQSMVMYLDAEAAGRPVTQNAVLRLHTAHPELEHARLAEEGLTVSDLKEEHWGRTFGQTVSYFEMQDPSGTTLQFFEDFVGEIKGFTLKRDV